ncbi:hypothetical protein SERLADRAFT_434024 [Serpula lacrymans var. lacrymans S7.9]|uniref:Uncharacterized protein n=1 Tax=Serpula lacrymans var. lacrymans (strain S7.9) TaxID=578457 RepID=F8NLC2_SERL9|nr:uncharacterized protein SERLADRAFT_434024 [Serpula lacrymans var. lacrymans S7.9]EGO28170.1 hypothetical protein SERLADRAFT_434024 [Serpula lacrymans var. lacrymans S7.9]
MHTITQEPVQRTLQHLSHANAALQHWCAQVWRRDFLYCSFTGDVLIPDPTLTSLASNHLWKTLEEIHEGLLAPWALDKELREAAKIEKRELKRQATEAAKLKRQEEVRRRRMQESSRRRAGMIQGLSKKSLAQARRKMYPFQGSLNFMPSLTLLSHRHPHRKPALVYTPTGL